MHTIYNDSHPLHHGKVEMFRGALVPCFEVPARVDFVLAELQRRGLGLIESAPTGVDDAAIARIHSQRYLDFLAGAWEEWVALDPANAGRDALPSYWPIRSFRTDVLPASFPARLGLFSFDAGSPLTAGTWRAARAGAGCALAAAAAVLRGERAAFALTRPPGHHAGVDFFGGYCFLNNAAIAAQALRDGGIDRVAILDIDYHHGNGTASHLLRTCRRAVQQPARRSAYRIPVLPGPCRRARRRRRARLQPQPAAAAVAPASRPGAKRSSRPCAALRASRPVRWSCRCGLDTFAGDPIAGFTLAATDYFRVGEDLAGAGLPTVFVFEGGYAVAEVGINAVNVLEGFMQRGSLSCGPVARTCGPMARMTKHARPRPPPDRSRDQGQLHRGPARAAQPAGLPAAAADRRDSR